MFVLVPFNDLNWAWNNLGTTPGFLTYPKWFQRYRVNSARITFTPIWTGAAASTNWKPAFAYVAALESNIGPRETAEPRELTLDSSNIAEQRFIKYRSIGNVSTGGRVKGVSAKMSTYKVIGGDRSVLVDDDWAGYCDVTVSRSTEAGSEPYNILYTSPGAVPAPSPPGGSTETASNQQLFAQFGIIPVGGEFPENHTLDYMVTYSYNVEFYNRQFSRTNDQKDPDPGDEITFDE